MTEREDVVERETVDITPSPRILQMLGKIEYEPWQCVAELIDNGFDEFLDIKRSGEPWTEAFQVEVSLPSLTGIAGGALVVSDNGRGMALDRVRNSVRAGFTGNDPLTKLGLFGMGFNVATARLGRTTTVLSSSEGDSDWIGVRIDLRDLREGFRVPVIRRPKRSAGEHGTRVEVTRLERLATDLGNSYKQRYLRERLGGVYSHLLSVEGFRLSVNGVQVKPRRHCVWSPARTVVRGRELIPAVIPIDQVLGAMAVCRDCGTWQDLDREDCEQCGSSELIQRERRVHGWLGIARNLEQKEFGIDFLRNGRKIMRLDKGLFKWRDPDDPTGQDETEYPIEVPANQGRIVGEIHLDHVPVSYLKDSFETSDRLWRSAVRILRGEGPLRPQRARELGYSDNNSPLARLYRGYRRNDPGKNYLTPGDGNNRKDTSDWVKKFREDDLAYQEDTHWWEAVLEHDRLREEEERRREEAKARQAGSIEDATVEFASDAETDGPSAQEETPPPSSPPMTEAQKIAAYREAGRRIPELSVEFSATGVPGRPVRLETFRLEGQAVTNMNGDLVPVWLVGERGGFVAFVGLDHPLFANFDDDPADIVLMELTQQMIVRARGATRPISEVFAELKHRYLNSRAIDPNRLVPEAMQLTRDIQERMVGCVQDSPDRPWENVLIDAERHFTADRITEVRRTSDIQSVVDSGEYLTLVPPAVVPRIVEEWPEAFFDGRLFAQPYATLSSPTARRQVVSTITSYLHDVAWLTNAPTTAPREQLIRARLSLQLLPNELAVLVGV